MLLSYHARSDRFRASSTADRRRRRSRAQDSPRSRPGRVTSVHVLVGCWRSRRLLVETLDFLQKSTGVFPPCALRRRPASTEIPLDRRMVESGSFPSYCANLVAPTRRSPRRASQRRISCKPMDTRRRQMNRSGRSSSESRWQHAHHGRHGAGTRRGAAGRERRKYAGSDAAAVETA